MNLRYQLRGVGVGMVVTALILGVVGKNAAGKMSDNEVVERAKQLGMVQGTETVGGSQTDKTGKNDTGTSDEKKSDTIPKKEEEPVDTRPMAEKEVIYSDEPVWVTIPDKSNYKEASQILYEHGLVNDAEEFAKYLANNGYSMKLVYGTYEIRPGTEESDIAKIITGR